MGVSVSDTYGIRQQYSTMRLSELRQRLANLPEVSGVPGLTIFSAGSYGRLEASQYSDIDLFFITTESQGTVVEPRTSELRLFGKIIETVDVMKFPKFSNDCEYLVVMHADDMLEHMGSRADDHANYFTARLLLLLESRCLHNDQAFSRIASRIVSSYFKDYPDHQQTFQPIFLLNDICRFWKTLLLNYENRRGLDPGAVGYEQLRTRQKVRNFKLKYSRMTTCFATIAALGSHLAPVTEAQVLEITCLTPRERLQSVADRIPTVQKHVDDVLERYRWFLDMTGLPTVELEKNFSDKTRRGEMFQLANDYGNSMFKLLQAIDETDPARRLMRNLVI